MDQTVISSILRILKDERFRSLHYWVSQGQIQYQDLMHADMPQGLSVEQTWELITALRKYLGSCGSVHETPHEEGSWYVENDEIRSILADIDVICQPYSHLSHVMEQRDVTSLFLQSFTDDILAGMKRDALHIEYETVRSLLLGEKEPGGYEERVTANTAVILNDLASYVDRDFDDGLVAELLSRALSGADGSRQDSFIEAVLKDPSHRQALQIIYGSGNNVCYEHPFRDMTAISFASWTYRPFNDLSGCMELLLRRLSLLKRKRPVFTLVPYSKAHLSVEGEERKTQSEGGIVTSDGVDYTPRILQLVRLFKEELNTLEQMAIKVEERDVRLLTIIESDREINSRQQRLVAQALCRPSAEFGIRAHAEYFNIVKASARSDLYGLVKLGFLRKEKRGKRIVFLPALGLPTLIAHHKPLYT
ncbi:MAG: hypothetical protein LBL23_06245 [Coriobacteriales bacterium]|jgi:hypothetical protein|nr:hypothetical protein [Coriobacteriales bacterium]